MDSSSNNQQDVTADECEKVVEKVVSLITASGSIASGLVNAHIARVAIYMAYLTYALGAASLALSVYNLMVSGNIMLSAVALVVLVVVTIVIGIITQKFKNVGKETSIYLGKAKGSLSIIEGLLKNRKGILERCLGKCSGRLCDDIRELIKYCCGSAVLACTEQQSY